MRHLGFLFRFACKRLPGILTEKNWSPLSSAVQLFCTIKSHLCCFTQFTVDQSKLTVNGSVLSDTPNVRYLVALLRPDKRRWAVPSEAQPLGKYIWTSASQDALFAYSLICETIHTKSIYLHSYSCRIV